MIHEAFRNVTSEDSLDRWMSDIERWMFLFCIVFYFEEVLTILKWNWMNEQRCDGVFQLPRICEFITLLVDKINGSRNIELTHQNLAWHSGCCQKLLHYYFVIISSNLV